MIIQLILIQIATFVVIIFVLRFLFGSQLKIALNRLQVLHQESLEKEEVLNKELQRAKTQSQNELARSREESKKIIETARHNVEKISLEASQRAEEEAKKIVAEAYERAKSREAEILQTVGKRSVALAQDLIKYTFTQKGSEALHAQFIDEIIEELKGVDSERLMVKADSAEIITSIPLSPEEKKRLQEVLLSKLNRQLAVEEKVDESLIIGLVIKLGGLVIDASLTNKMNKALSALRQDLRI